MIEATWAMRSGRGMISVSTAKEGCKATGQRRHATAGASRIVPGNVGIAVMAADTSQ